MKTHQWRRASASAAALSVLLAGSLTGCEGVVARESAGTESTCSTTGTCTVGDRGPGGGWIIHVGPPGSNLEVAPQAWAGATEPLVTWAAAKTAATTYAGGGKADWRLPELLELIDLYNCTFKDTIGGFDNSSFYWSSHVRRGNQDPMVVGFAKGTQMVWRATDKANVRPVRTF